MLGAFVFGDKSLAGYDGEGAMGTRNAMGTSGEHRGDVPVRLIVQVPIVPLRPNMSLNTGVSIYMLVSLRNHY
jgi:hypothetical protein